MYRSLVVVAVLAAGCTAGYRTATGGATAKAGVGGGTTSSIYIGDRGGLFSRLGLGVLGGIAAMGTVSNVSTSTSQSGIYDQRTGNRIGTETTTTTTGTVDVEKGRQLQQSLDGMEKAADDSLKGGAIDPTENYGSMSGGLEIAAQSLGGDTSGWMFDFGFRGAQRYGAWGFRTSLKFGFGKYTFHERTVRRSSATSESMEDSTYTFLGFPLRLGITLYGIVEVFGQLDLNLATWFNEGLLGDQAASPSPWRAGARFSVAKYLYIEGAIALSTMREVNRSTMVEAGFEF